MRSDEAGVNPISRAIICIKVLMFTDYQQYCQHHLRGTSTPISGPPLPLNQYFILSNIFSRIKCFPPKIRNTSLPGARGPNLDGDPQALYRGGEKCDAFFEWYHFFPGACICLSYFSCCLGTKMESLSLPPFDYHFSSRFHFKTSIS